MSGEPPVCHREPGESREARAPALRYKGHSGAQQRLLAKALVQCEGSRGHCTEPTEPKTPGSNLGQCCPQLAGCFLSVSTRARLGDDAELLPALATPRLARVVDPVPLSSRSE